mmetsp:Transcript_5667/g.10810  ORF Transcript_5667/g.10810 Transcript_5667/m.10810 type:complete len:607 (-) Transcript_5667:179-1999(-)
MKNSVLSVSAERVESGTKLLVQLQNIQTEKRVVIAVFLRNFNTGDQYKWQDQQETAPNEWCEFLVEATGGNLMFVSYLVDVDQEVIRAEDKLGRIFVDLADIFSSPDSLWAGELSSSLSHPKKKPRTPLKSETSSSGSSSITEPVDENSPSWQKGRQFSTDRQPDSVLKLFVSCRNLPQRNWLSENDAMVAVFEEKINFVTGETRFDYLDQTEWVEGTNDPRFQKEVLVEHYQGSRQKIKFSVYDVNSEDPDYIPTENDRIGSVLLDLDELVSSLNQESSSKIHPQVTCKLEHFDVELNAKLRARNSIFVIGVTSPSLQPASVHPVAETAKATEEKVDQKSDAGGSASGLVDSVAVEPKVRRKERFFVSRRLCKQYARMVRFQIRCINLVQRDWLVKNDSIVAVFERNPEKNEFEHVDQTEFVEQNNDPEFQEMVELEYVPDAVQSLRFNVYDVDGSAVQARNVIGSVDVSLDHIMRVVDTSRDRQFVCQLHHSDPEKRGFLSQKGSSLLLTLMEDKTFKIQDFNPKRSMTRGFDKRSKSVLPSATFYNDTYYHNSLAQRVPNSHLYEPVMSWDEQDANRTASSFKGAPIQPLGDSRQCKQDCAIS